MSFNKAVEVSCSHYDGSLHQLQVLGTVRYDKVVELSCILITLMNYDHSSVLTGICGVKLEIMEFVHAYDV